VVGRVQQIQDDTAGITLQNTSVIVRDTTPDARKATFKIPDVESRRRALVHQVQPPDGLKGLRIAQTSIDARRPRPWAEQKQALGVHLNS